MSFPRIIAIACCRPRWHVEGDDEEDRRDCPRQRAPPIPTSDRPASRAPDWSRWRASACTTGAVADAVLATAGAGAGTGACGHGQANDADDYSTATAIPRTIDLGNASAWAGAIITITGDRRHADQQQDEREARPATGDGMKSQEHRQCGVCRTTPLAYRGTNAASAYAISPPLPVMTSPTDIFSEGRTGRLAAPPWGAAPGRMEATAALRTTRMRRSHLRRSASLHAVSPRPAMYRQSRSSQVAQHGDHRIHSRASGFITECSRARPRVGLRTARPGGTPPTDRRAGPPRCAPGNAAARATSRSARRRLQRPFGVSPPCATPSPRFPRAP